MPQSDLHETVYQSNVLVNARKKLNTLGLKLFLLGLQGLSPQLPRHYHDCDDSFKEIFIPVWQLSRECYEVAVFKFNLENFCRTLSNSTIEILAPDGVARVIRIFEYISYDVDSGLYIKFDEAMAPYLLRLSHGKYTAFEPRNLFRLTSSYAIRLLELLLQYQHLSTTKESGEIVRVMTQEQLRFALNISDFVYRDARQSFRSNILSGPIREINAKTHYKIWCNSSSRGNFFEFHLEPKSAIMNCQQ